MLIPATGSRAHETKGAALHHIRLTVLLAAALALGVAVPSHHPGVASAAPAATHGVTSSTNVAAIGLSAQGRPIDVGCLGQGDHTVLLVGGLHTGMESISSDLVLELATLLWSGAIDLPSNLRLCLLPTLNPDGVVLDLHTNARGVDLNRNWPAANWAAWAFHPETGDVSGGDQPLSEPETSALYHYIAETRPALVVVFHCCGSLVEANSASPAIALGQRYAAAAGFDYIDVWQHYTITGQFIDAMDHLGIPAIDVELERPDHTGLAQHRAALSAVLTILADQTPTPLGAPELPSTATLYVVQPGDTLANIAWHHGVNVDVLAVANGIYNPELIEVGDPLTIPWSAPR